MTDTHCICGSRKPNAQHPVCTTCRNRLPIPCRNLLNATRNRHSREQPAAYVEAVAMCHAWLRADTETARAEILANLPPLPAKQHRGPREISLKHHFAHLHDRL